MSVFFGIELQECIMKCWQKYFLMNLGLACSFSRSHWFLKLFLLACARSIIWMLDCHFWQLPFLIWLPKKKSSHWNYGRVDSCGILLVTPTTAFTMENILQIMHTYIKIAHITWILFFVSFFSSKDNSFNYFACH